MSLPATEKERKDPSLDDEKGTSPRPSEHDVLEKAKIIEVSNADYALALSTGPQLSPTSPKSLQLFAILLVSFMGSLSNGFDGSGENFLIRRYSTWCSCFRKL
jgi:hypothetical protein